MSAEPFKYDGALDAWKCNHILRFCQGSALDIGCNTGNLVAFLNRTGIPAVGIDSESAHVEAARKAHPDCEFHCGTELRQFSDKQFESVIAWNVLEHIEDDVGALQEMIRIASRNVILSIPKEDDLSLPDSRVTYRPYVDPTHRHYYTRQIIAGLLAQTGAFKAHIEDASRVRPLLAYAKIGIPRWLCATLDSIFWRLGGDKTPLLANLIVVIDVGGGRNIARKSA
ncbi:Class I SAM-dependent methyltransferase [Rubrivivax sp. A210]|uniref:class I SAM-dependent methyltransferase n=1 Tax=Rubrivivax sp. A210 TaxID=2772301 RepID=UPI001918E293|nr:class I SAM-dependent methyltransferase [Rubrivivax sp. A210]CAD5372459.1 Class I SAM-dependent methyltransferase [Rubrivivax sp. A210]